jgi:uncharacterized protein involved in exopolysaccharide biosynthesis/Mrp family chromosome partitioning ATPase
MTRVEPRAVDTSVDLPLLRLARIVFRRALCILLVFLALGALALAWALTLKPAYRSEAKVLVQVGRESVTLDPTVTLGGATLDPRNTRENELNSELEVARGESLRRALVAELGAARILGRGTGPSTTPGRLARWQDAAVALARRVLPSEGGPELSDEDLASLLLAEKLEVRLVLDSSVLKIGYPARAPELARDVVAAYTALYLAKHMAVYETAGSLEFLRAEHERLAQALAAAEDAREALRLEAGVYALDEQRRSLVERIGARETELSQAAAEVAAGEAQVAALRAGLESGSFPPTVVLEEVSRQANALFDFLRQEAARLRIEERALLATYAPEASAVQAVREQLALAEGLLARENPERAEITRGASATRAQAELALLTAEGLMAGQRARAGVIAGRRQDLQGELDRLSAAELELQRLTRTIGTLERRVAEAAGRRAQGEAEEELRLRRITNVRVLEPATLPLRRTGLGKKAALALGLVLAALGALAAGFVREFFDQSLSSTGELRERLGLPALGAIPLALGLWRWRRVALAGRAEFAAVRDHLPPAAGGRARVIAVTSAHRREGKSTVAANLAAVLARAGQPVLLVDAHVRAPVLHRSLGQELEPGLAGAARAGARPAPRATAVEHLAFLPAGRAKVKGLKESEPVCELLARTLPGWIEGWRGEYAHVVLDLPPLSQSSPVLRLAGTCDATVLVVAAEKYRWQIAREAAEELVRAGALVPGAVLTRRRFHVPGWLYHRL